MTRHKARGGMRHLVRGTVHAALASLLIAGCTPRVEPSVAPEPAARLEAMIESLGERIEAQQALLDALVLERDSLRADATRLELALRARDDS